MSSRSMPCTVKRGANRFRRSGCWARCWCSCCIRLRSERMVMEKLEYNLLFRWILGLSANEAVWQTTVFTKNRERLQEGQPKATDSLRAVTAHVGVQVTL